MTDRPDWKPIEYPTPGPRYPCRIHGTTPCTSACRGKQPIDGEEPAWKRALHTGGRRAGKSAALEAFQEMARNDPSYQALMRGPEIPMHWLEPVEVIPLCMVRGIAQPRDVECRTTRNTGEVSCPQCIEALSARHCRHRGGVEDCGPMCLLLFGDCFYTQMVEVPNLGDRPEDVQVVPGQPMHISRYTEENP